MDVESILKEVEIVSGDSKFIACCCCHDVSLSSEVSSCGHIFCSDCKAIIFSDSGKVTCPVDQQNIIQEEFSIKQDHKLKVMRLVVTCPNKRKGCKFVGKLHEMKHHLNVCDCESVNLCPQGCQASINSKNLSSHLQNDCPHRFVTCNFCKIPVPFISFQKHAEECNYFPVMCHFNCGFTAQRSQMAAHSAVCAQRVCKCKFSELGCNFQAHESMMRQHEKNIEIHLDVILNANLRSKLMIDCALSKMEGDVQELKNENVMLKNAMEDCNKNLGVMKKHTIKLSERIVLIQEALKMNDFDDDKRKKENVLDVMLEQFEEIHLLIRNIDQDLQTTKASMKQSRNEGGAQAIKQEEHAQPNVKVQQKYEIYPQLAPFFQVLHNKS